MLLQVNNLKHTYILPNESLTIFENLTLSVQQGESIAIMGASGAGKSTLLHILGGLNHPTLGQVYIEGTDIWKLSVRQLARCRNQKIGFVFQFHYLLPEFSALENVQVPMLVAGMSYTESAKIAFNLLERVGIESRSSHYPSELSGGESQRVAIARALANNPVLLLADEPTGNLDEVNGEKIRCLLHELHLEKQLTSIIVTHNTSLANTCDRVLYLKEGQLDSISKINTMNK